MRLVLLSILLILSATSAIFSMENREKGKKKVNQIDSSSQEWKPKTYLELLENSFPHIDKEIGLYVLKNGFNLTNPIHREILVSLRGSERAKPMLDNIRLKHGQMKNIAIISHPHAWPCATAFKSNLFITPDHLSINIIDLNSGNVTKTIKNLPFDNFENGIFYLAAIDQNTLVIGTDSNILVYDIKEEKRINLLQASNWIKSLSIINKHTIIYGCLDGSVKTWNFKTNKKNKFESKHKGHVWCLAKLSPNMIASGSQDMTIKIWDIKTGQCIATLKDHANSVHCLLKVGKNSFASGSSDKTIKIWDIETGECKHTLTGHESTITTLENLSEDIIASGSEDGTVQIWDLNTCKNIRVLLSKEQFEVCFIKKYQNTLAAFLGHESLTEKGLVCQYLAKLVINQFPTIEEFLSQEQLITDQLEKGNE